MQGALPRVREPIAAATEDRFLTRGHRAQHDDALRHGSEARQSVVSSGSAAIPADICGLLAGRRYCDETAKKLDRAAREIQGRLCVNAVAVLTGNRRILEEGARKLLKKEPRSEADIAVSASSLVREDARGSNTRRPL
jgi:hypothetical protein